MSAALSAAARSWAPSGLGGASDRQQTVKCSAGSCRNMAHRSQQRRAVVVAAAGGSGSSASSSSRRRVSVIAAAGGGGNDEQKPSFGDELLDFMYAGKKLRKWYGQQGQVLPRDGRLPPEGQQPAGDERQGQEEEEEEGPREYVAVLDADSSPMAEQVVLQLILNRAKIRALVKDAAAAKAGFGPYIEAVQGDAADAAALRRLLRGAKAAVCCGRLGALLPAAAAARLPHVVLLSAAGGGGRGGGLAGLFASAEDKELADSGREAQLKASGLPCFSIVQVGGLAGTPGGESRLAVTAGGTPPQGAVSREDAAKALAEAAERDPAAGPLVLQLASGGAGEQPEDWQALLQQLAAQSAAA